MDVKELKEGIVVYDEDASQFGEGVVITCEDNMIDVYYQDIEETVTYSQREAVKHLNIVEL